jgi:hypothetical protein
VQKYKSKKTLAIQEEFGRDSSLLNSVSQPNWRFPMQRIDEMMATEFKFPYYVN